MTRDQLIALLALGQRAEDLLSSIRVLQDLSEPSKVENVSASNNGSTNTVSWSEAIGAPRISHYRIYRDAVFLTTATASPHEDSNLSNGTYSYTVSAVDGNGREGEQSSASEATVAITPPNPDTPINFRASAASTTSIVLSWSAGPTGPAPTDYDLDFSTAGASGPWTNIAVVGLQTSYTHTTLTTATQYWYRLAAFNGISQSAGYATDTETTNSPPTVGAVNFYIPAGTAGVWSGTTARVPEQGGAARAVRPGDIIEFRPGTFGSLDLQDIQGSASNRVTIRGPQSGSSRAIISSSGGDILEFTRCRHINFDGETPNSSIATGGLAPYVLKRSIWVRSTGNYTHIIKFQGAASSTYQNTRDITIRYIEISGPSSTTGGSALASNDTANDAFSADNSSNWQENILYEYNYIHDIGKEGMYVGPNVYIGQGSQGSPKPLRYIKIRYNVFENIGWEPIQAKKWGRSYTGLGNGGISGIDDGSGTSQGINAIHHNIMVNVGINPTHDDDMTAISCLHCENSIYNNWIQVAGDNGINCNNEDLRNGRADGGGRPQSQSNTHHVFNNVVMEIGGNWDAAIYTGDSKEFACIRASGASAALAGVLQNVYIFNNTCMGANETNQRGINQGNVTAASFARNNIVVDNDGADVNGSESNNTTGTSGTRFVQKTGAYGTRNMHLTAQIAASGTLGTDIATFDYDDVTRTAPYTNGAYEF